MTREQAQTLMEWARGGKIPLIHYWDKNSTEDENSYHGYSGTRNWLNGKCHPSYDQIYSREHISKLSFYIRCRARDYPLVRLRLS